MHSKASPQEPITFVIPVGNDDVYQKCFLSSPLFSRSNVSSDFQIIAQRGFKGAAAAFNDGIERTKNDLIVCVHQDVILPVKWAERFVYQVKQLEDSGVQVGTVGCIGCRFDGEMVGHVYHRERQIFPNHSLPARIQALDELLVAFRKSSGLRFDRALPGFFGYAPDICMQAVAKGLQNFVVEAPCIHETTDRRMARRDMYSSWKYLRRKWKAHLPIHTPTISIGGKWDFWRAMIKECVFDITGYKPRPWWLRLQPVKRDDVLYADTLRRI